MFIDSGLDDDLNLVKLETLEEIKSAARKSKVKIHELNCTKSAPLVFAYSHPDKALEILGGVEIDIAPTKNPSLKISSKIYAVDAAQDDLIGRVTAEKLHCIQLGYRDRVRDRRRHRAPDRVYNISVTEKDFMPFPEFPDFKLHLDIDESVAPKMRNFYMIPDGTEEETIDALRKLLKQQIISRSKFPGSAWVSPLLAVRKPNGEIRLCVDLTEVNKAVRRSFSHPMPTLRQMIDFSKGKNLFAKIDLRKAFYHIKLHEKSRYLTTFKSPDGYFYFNRMPFGLNVAPEVFQSLLEGILAHLKNVKVYLDDIIIAADNQSELDKTFDEVMKILSDHNFQVNNEKVEKNVSEIEFVGFKLSKDGVKLTEERVESILSMKAPDNMKILKSFLGKVNFLNSFLPRLSDVAAPMWKIARSENFEWNDEQEISFEKVKELIASNEGRCHFETDLPTYLITDASPDAISAVLIQIDNKSEKRKVRVIEYASKLLTKIQKNYPHFQKEILGIVSAVKHFRSYLIYHKFTILTDLKTAGSIIQKSISGHTKEVKRHDRWMMDMREFTYDIKHLPGCLNIADALSRLATVTTMHEVVDELGEKDQLDGEENGNFWTKEKLETQKRCCVVCNVIAKEKWTISCNEVCDETLNDPEMQQVISQLERREENLIDKKWKHEKLPLWINDDGLLIKGHMIVLPRTLRLRAIRIAHATHMGKDSTVALLKQYVFWPGMTSDVANILNECEDCKIMHDHKQSAPMKRVELPNGPWEHIALDFYDAPSIGVKVLVVVDYFSRYLIIKQMKSGSDAGKLIKTLKDVFYTYGVARKIRSDNGQPMRSQEFSDWCAQMGIEQEFSPARHPQGNGMVERAMQGVKNALMYAQLKKIDWREHLRLHESLYNNVPHRTTKVSPNSVHLGKKTDVGLPIQSGGSSVHVDHEKMRQQDRENKEKGKIYQDQYVKARNSTLKVGDLVWIKREEKKNKLDTPYLPDKYEIKSRIGNTVILVDPKTPNADGISRNVEKVLKCPMNAAERIRNDILADIVRSTESERDTINDLPIELFHNHEISSILGTSTIITREIDKQVEIELNDDEDSEAETSETRPKRKTAIESIEKLRELKKKHALRICFIQTLQ